jgi:predicted flap endonuclease-1-like 5' DNA nuclease
MIYLIGQLSLWLFLTAAFAALAGWAFAARRSAPAERTLRRERDNLLRDLVGMALGESGAANDEAERLRTEDAVKGQLDVREARIAELEQALERARDGADNAAGEIAELQRRLERTDADARELERLRALETAREQQQLIDVQIEEPEPARDDVALQAWRLRYFEQRVRYLEGLARAEPSAMKPALVEEEQPETSPEMLAADWRARDAEARASFLENEMRSAPEAAHEPEPQQDLETPFAANADVDMLLRWRLLYLERRVAHLQGQAAPAVTARLQPVQPEPAPLIGDATPDPDRWKWRARYLEARVRHLEQRSPVAMLSREPDSQLETAAEESVLPPPSDQPRRKPSVLSSPSDGAPDDLTLIEGVSALQQSTLYSIGVYHFDQIAAWTPENIAWVDHYLRLRGRIDEEDWVEQAAALARELAGA